MFWTPRKNDDKEVFNAVRSLTADEAATIDDITGGILKYRYGLCLMCEKNVLDPMIIFPL